MSDIGSLSNISRGDGTPTIYDVQREARAWRRKSYPATSGADLQALGVAEEVGELCHAVLKHKQGIRGYDYEKARAEIADAIGDIYIYMSGVADQYDIDMTDAILAAWVHVKKRNITQGSDPGMGPSAVDCFSPVEENVNRKQAREFSENRGNAWVDKTPVGED